MMRTTIKTIHVHVRFFSMKFLNFSLTQNVVLYREKFINLTPQNDKIEINH